MHSLLKRLYFLGVLAGLFVNPLPAATTARVLLVTGQDYPGHPWRETAPALKGLLEKDGRLQVCVTEDPHLLDSQAVGNYDVILLHFMNWEQPAPGPAAWRCGSSWGG